MNIFSNLKTEVRNKVPNMGSTYESKIGEFINRRYENLWHTYLWGAIINVDEQVTATSGQQHLFLPKNVELIIALTQRTTNAVLTPNSPYIFQSKYLDVITNQSNPVAYMLSGEKAIQRTISNNTLTVSSSAAGDTTQSLRVNGKKTSTSDIITETISLNGTTGVNSANNYDDILTLSLSAVTTGIVTITDGTNTLCTINPGELTSRYLKIRFQPVPNTNETMYLTYKRRFRKLINDEDVIEINIEPLIIQGAFVDVLKEMGKFEEAQTEGQEFQQLLSTYIMEKETQSDNQPVFQPHIEKIEDDEFGYSNI